MITPMDLRTKTFKKALALLLSIILVFSVCSVAATAQSQTAPNKKSAAPNDITLDESNFILDIFFTFIKLT